MSGKKNPRTSDQQQFERIKDSINESYENKQIRLSRKEWRNFRLVDVACTVWLKKRGLQVESISTIWDIPDSECIIKGLPKPRH